ncbi:endolytic transglycosylase MltG [Thalassotalea sp. LPB0316]|uniref:endolytic transglycosylase MltG n=1 Tax=Thalassotalea sp. LPB0316 TaxID=2769490 RepID=UPI001868683C|nr:endolytic transglycosylase MltG [Thalassotalea sp. LPB0316]QOL24810.1 endolytic transglycosylase MltG [Thalassotalea sp. LPB0316]
MKRLFLAVIALALIGLFIAIGSYYYAYQQINQPMLLESEELFEVKQGQTVRQVAKSFERQGWVNSHFWLKLYTKFNSSLSQVKEGVYLIKPQQSLYQALEMIVANQEHQFSVTFIEGSTYAQWLKVLANAEYLEHTLTNQESTLVLTRLNIEAEHPEGLFFPDTYAYTAGTKDIEILKRAFDKMDSYLQQAWRERADLLPYETPYHALIMASIIEKETGQRSEQPLIASVFVNRLYKKMRLQTDPTVIYGLGDSYQGDITRAHLKQKIRYNTYRINGLPPTPIAMPGKSAIDAALHPESSDYYYFVSKGNGWHQFSKTLKEHNKAVAKYQLGQE